MSLSTKVLLGLAIGVIFGIFFGEQVAFLKIFGDAFIMLMQMTVLPYIMVSLVSGLGSLSSEQAFLLVKRSGVILLVLWLIGITMVLLTPFAFPNWEMASFFSASMIEKKPPFNFLGLYIPSNLFNSLANNTVPAVVVFSFFLGSALIPLKNKDVLLKPLSVISTGLSRITRTLINIAPFGVFAIIASATGTMSFGDLERLQVYMLTYVVISILLSFWILPALLTTLTPFSYRELVGPIRTALITAFATANLFVVLPVLVERSKELISKLEPDSDDAKSTVDVIISTSFCLPNMGKLLNMSFVLFAGWFSNSTVPISKYITFGTVGFFSFFGSLTVAIPFLMDLMRIPSDTFKFFPIVDNLIGNKFGALLAGMYTIVLAVLGTCSARGFIKISWIKLFRYIVITIILTFAAIGGTRFFFENIIGHEYRDSEVFMKMDLSKAAPDALIFNDSLPEPVKDINQKNRVSSILDRGFLRIGYYNDALPYAFINANKKLVGLDIEMAYNLANELGVRPEMVKVDRARASEMLDSGYADIIMGGITITLDNAKKMELSDSYLDQTLAFIVKDYRRDDFSSRENVKSLKKLKIGIINAKYYIDKIKNYLPQAEIVILNSIQEYFTSKGNELDAMVYTAEAGSAWSLIYPEYTAAIPQPDILSIPLTYAMPKGETEFVQLVNKWIDLKKKDMSITRLYNHWILGQNLKEKEKRWSVVRNVLHWVD